MEIKTNHRIELREGDVSFSVEIDDNDKAVFTMRKGKREPVVFEMKSCTAWEIANWLKDTNDNTPYREPHAWRLNFNGHEWLQDSITCNNLPAVLEDE